MRAYSLDLRERVVNAYAKGEQSIAAIAAMMLVEGAVDTLCFHAFCENFVRPCLRIGDVLVLDNLGAHRASRIEEIAAGCWARVIWLPPYSPDFSPIEQMWSRVENISQKSQGANRKRTRPRHC